MRSLLQFLTDHFHWLLFVLLEVVSLALLFRQGGYQGSVWVSSANEVAGRVYEASSAVETYLTLGQANEQLTLRNFYLERQVGQLRRLYTQATGDTLRPATGQTELLARYHLIPAKVVENSLTGPDNLITINRGSDDGITKDMGVVSGLGVVGVTYMVGPHYTVVLPLLNSHSRISCTIRGRGYFGYITWDGSDPAEAWLEDLPRHARFRHGDWIETNGYSTIFPEGILIGRTATVYNSPDGLSYRVKVHLATDFARLRDVAVISDSTIAERARLKIAARDTMALTNR